MNKIKYVVIFQQLTTVPSGITRDGLKYAFTYSLATPRRFDTRKAAISAGFELRGSDDFNVAVLTDGRLTWFGWMDEGLAHDLDEIAAQIGVDR